MSQFEVRAQLKVREGKLEEFKQQAAEMMRQATGEGHRERSPTTGSSMRTEPNARSAKPMWTRTTWSITRSTSETLGTPCSPSPPTTTGWRSTASRRPGSGVGEQDRGRRHVFSPTCQALEPAGVH